MGYRSEVGLVFQIEDFEEKLGHASKEIHDAVRDLLDHADSDEELLGEGSDEHYRLLHWTDIKWYEAEYAAMKWLRLYLTLTPSTSSFIRVGEREDDVENHRGDAYDLPFHLRLSHSVTW
jgi:hypothetical protein